MIRRLLVSVCLIASGMAVIGSGSAIAKEQKGDPAASFKKDYPAVTYESVGKTDIEGVYEVVAGGNVFYYHPASGNVLFGEMITRTFTNITADRRNSLMAEKLKSLPLDKALRIGTGKHVVVEFTDIDCPFCRKIEEYFEKCNDVTRYVFLLPLDSLHPDSRKKSLKVLCSDNRIGAYKDAMKGAYDGKDLSVCDDEEAAKLLEQHKAMAGNLGIQGTPALWVDTAPVMGANIPLIDQLLSSDAIAQSQRKEVKP